jgi:hypothetical protein
LEIVDIFYGHLEYVYYGPLGYVMTIWYILYSFVTFCPALVSCTKKNLATPIVGTSKQVTPISRRYKKRLLRQGGAHLINCSVQNLGH